MLFLRSEHHQPRAGEEIIKQQVEYKHPGRAGENVLWDFGQLKPVNSAYTLTYSEPEMTADSLYILGMDTIPADSLKKGSLLTGSEHHTRYYYYQTDSLLQLMGHENPTTLLQYTGRLTTAAFPMHYRDSLQNSYRAKGRYSSTVPFTTEGSTELKADAFGTMILPSGDTLQHVIRTRMNQTIRQRFVMNDTLTVEQNSSVETFKWYAKGYRYPVFETVQTTVFGDTAGINFETAFFFPPQEQYFLEKDPVNLALLEEEEQQSGLETDTLTDPWAGLTYNIFPNPVKDTPLEVEIYLPREAAVRIQLRKMNGLTVIDRNEGTHPAGICRFRLPAYTLPVDNYILDIWLNDKLIEGIILKR